MLSSSLSINGFGGSLGKNSVLEIEMMLFLDRKSDLLMTLVLDWLDARSLQLLDIVIINGDEELLRMPHRDMRSIWQSCFDRFVKRIVNLR